MSEKNIVNKGPGRQPPTRGTANDSRVLRSKELVLRVTLELLTESGLGGVSVDEVSRRSGVAKTTIYRHWPTRSDLVMEACSQISTQQEVPDTGSFEGDIASLLTSIADLLRTARWSSVMPSIIDSAERDPALAEIHSRIQLGHTTPLYEIIAKAKRNGKVSSDTDPSAMVAALLGPLYYRRWFSRESLDNEFVKQVIQTVVGHS